ncbi:MAG TPA: cytochrome P450 [Bryobacteraceae bacterium]|jgi:cytochrome P450
MKRTYPDGPRINLPLAVIGQMLPQWFPFDPLAFTLGIAQNYGDIAHYKLGALHVFQLNRPELVRQVLVEQAEKFVKPGLVKRAFRPFAGAGLFTSDGALWRRQRKLMQPAFQHRQLATYAGVMTEHAERVMNSFVDGEIRDIRAEMTKLTLGIVVRSLFGADITREASEISPLMVSILDATNQRLNTILRIPSWVPTLRNLREKRAVNKLEAVLQVLIRTRRVSSENRDDLLSVLLRATDGESGAQMSDQQLRDELMTLFLAGHETTASALTWTWYLVAQHPEVETRLAGELQRVLAGRTPSVDDLAKLPYTEMVLREAIRLYPPAPGVAREPIEDVSIGGYDVPKGSIVTINMYALHHDGRFFDDPERYDPDRFAPGWEERIPRYAYLPFGSGPRVCIGNGFAMMEARLILASMAQRYRLSLESGEPVRPVQLVTIRPAGPVRMRISRRTV